DARSTEQARSLCYATVARQPSTRARVTQASCLTGRACFQLAQLPLQSAEHSAKTTYRSSLIRKLHRLTSRLETPGLDKKSVPRSESPASGATSQHRHLYLHRRSIGRSA